MDAGLTSKMGGVIANRKMKSSVLIVCVMLWFVSSAIAQQHMVSNEMQQLPDNHTVAQEPSHPISSNIPVGTAVAPAVPVTGVAVFSPAGAAIAPAKQHRTRTI